MRHFPRRPMCVIADLPAIGADKQRVRDQIIAGIRLAAERVTPVEQATDPDSDLQREWRRLEAATTTLRQREDLLDAALLLTHGLRRPYDGVVVAADNTGIGRRASHRARTAQAPAKRLGG